MINVKSGVYQVDNPGALMINRVSEDKKRLLGIIGDRTQKLYDALNWNTTYVLEDLAGIYFPQNDSYNGNIGLLERNLIDMYFTPNSYNILTRKIGFSRAVHVDDLLVLQMVDPPKRQSASNIIDNRHPHFYELLAPFCHFILDSNFVNNFTNLQILFARLAIVEQKSECKNSDRHPNDSTEQDNRILFSPRFVVDQSIEVFYYNLKSDQKILDTINKRLSVASIEQALSSYSLNPPQLNLLESDVQNSCLVRNLKVLEGRPLSEETLLSGPNVNRTILDKLYADAHTMNEFLESNELRAHLNPFQIHIIDKEYQLIRLKYRRFKNKFEQKICEHGGHHLPITKLNFTNHRLTRNKYTKHWQCDNPDERDNVDKFAESDKYMFKYRLPNNLDLTVKKYENSSIRTYD